MDTGVKQLECKRCGHVWFPRQPEIRICPKCKTAYWDRPKKVKPNELR